MSELHETLERDIVLSETLRASILAGVAGSVVVYIGVLIFADPRPDSTVNVVAMRMVFASMFGVFAAYAFAIRQWMVRLHRASRSMPHAYGFITTAFEVTFVSCVLVAAEYILGPLQGLNSSIVMLYAVFILPSALQMNIGPPLFGAALAIAQYLGLVLVFVKRADPAITPGWLLEFGPYVAWGVGVGLVGATTAFVAVRQRKAAIHLIVARRERDDVANTFGRHVSPKVVDQLLQQGTQPQSEMRHVCVMFLDIRNFTTLSEGRSPIEVVDLLNELFDFMIDAVNQHDGIINKFLGDGFMAVFGAPLSDGRDAQNAVDAAREIIARLEESNARQGRSIGIGIGLHAGEVVAGSIGSKERTEYTVIGDVVNVAARIESLNKQFGAQLLVSGAVVKELSAEQLQGAEDLGEVAVKGRAEKVPIVRLA